MKRHLLITFAVAGSVSYLAFIPAHADQQNPLSYTAIHTIDQNSSTKNQQTPARKFYNSGMRFKTVNNPQAPSTPNPPQVRAPQTSAAAAAKTEAEDETPSQRVWRKYKALATGQQSETPQTKNTQTNIQKTLTPREREDLRALGALPTKETAQAATVTPTSAEQTKTSDMGFASILQEYRRAKEQRKSLRTLSVNPPSALKNSSSGANTTQESNVQ